MGKLTGLLMGVDACYTNHAHADQNAVGLSVGPPFFIRHCRVGVLHDIGEVLKPDVVILLIGEHPGLGCVVSLSAYMAYRPKAGDTDADRDVVSNIFSNDGTDPLIGTACILQLAQKMMQYQADGVRLKWKLTT